MRTLVETWNLFADFRDGGHQKKIPSILADVGDQWVTVATIGVGMTIAPVSHRTIHPNSRVPMCKAKSQKSGVP